jgi:hypothetical protein
MLWFILEAFADRLLTPRPGRGDAQVLELGFRAQYRLRGKWRWPAAFAKAVVATGTPCDELPAEQFSVFRIDVEVFAFAFGDVVVLERRPWYVDRFGRCL